MTTRKFMYIGADGYYDESAGAYETTDFINTSAGAGDAGKPIVLDAAGHVDATMINDADVSHANLTGTHNLTTDIDHSTITGAHNLTTDIDHDQLTNTHNLTTNIDHGSISGLADDDHSQYLLTAGTRDITGIIAYDSSKTFNDAAQLVDKNYVDTQIAATGTSAEWQESVIDRFDPTSGLPGSPSTGDRYLATATANGWTTNYIYEYNGATWDETIPTTGTYVSVDDETDGLYYFGGSSWTKKSFEALTASLGVEISSSNIQLDLYASGGLAINTNEAYVDVDVLIGEGLTSTGSAPTKDIVIDWSTAFNDSKAVKASDLASTSNGLGASIIGIEDSGGYTSTTDVEAALAEIFAKIDGYGTSYTAGAGGVTKGDLVYVSANDTILPMTSLTSGEYGVGLAASTESAAASVKVLGNDNIITGVLSGATAGDKYYWNGTGFTTTIPTGSGNNVWQAGIAKNATDLQIEIAFLLRRA